MLFSHIVDERVWEEERVSPFEELILSWNAARPKTGEYQIFLSVHSQWWSDWMPYAFWGSDTQMSFRTQTPQACISQDTLIAKQKLDGFRVKIVCKETDLSGFRVLYACTSNPTEFQSNPVGPLPGVQLPLKSLLSQRNLKHPRHLDLCSPTSTTMAIQFLLKEIDTDPLHFAKGAHDAGFDIYGNWAEASHRLGEKFSCYIERLSGFTQLHELLLQELPVVVSVQGPLKGAPLPYANGHLILVSGWDPVQKRVLCADPAEPNVMTSYALSDFLIAWGRRRNLAYLFKKKVG